MHLPIVLFVYNRLEHFKNCIDHLKSNPESKYSDLYICSDAPSCIEHKEAVELVRAFSKQIVGFKQVHLIFHPQNIGSLNNLLVSYKNVFEKHDALIALEDDVFVGKYFLKYLNNGIEKYKNNSTIFAICAYMFPIKFYFNYMVVKLPIFNAWGYAITKKSWDSLNINFEELESYINNPLAINYFKSNFNIADIVLKEFYIQKKIPLDALICYHLYVNHLRCLFPLKTLTLNKGHDGSGENCTEDFRFIKQKYMEHQRILKLNHFPFSSLIMARVNKFFNVRN